MNNSLEETRAAFAHSLGKTIASQVHQVWYVEDELLELWPGVWQVTFTDGSVLELAWPPCASLEPSLGDMQEELEPGEFAVGMLEPLTGGSWDEMLGASFTAIHLLWEEQEMRGVLLEASKGHHILWEQLDMDETFFSVVGPETLELSHLRLEAISTSI